MISMGQKCLRSRGRLKLFLLLREGESDEIIWDRAGGREKMLMCISDCSRLLQTAWDWLQIYKSEHRRERQSRISYETGSNCLLPPTSMANCRHLVMMLISALSTKGKHWKGWKEGPEVSQQPSPLSFSLSPVPCQPLTSWLRSLLHSFCWVFRFNRRLLFWACPSVSSNSDSNSSVFPIFPESRIPWGVPGD